MADQLKLIYPHLNNQGNNHLEIEEVAEVLIEEAEEEEIEGEEEEIEGEVEEEVEILCLMKIELLELDLLHLEALLDLKKDYDQYFLYILLLKNINLLIINIIIYFTIYKYFPYLKIIH